MPARSPVRARLISVLATAALVPAAGACTSTAHNRPSDPAPTASSTVVAARWWSNSAAEAGTTIDPANPRAAAHRLHGSKSDYCSMLKQTVTAGRSILPGVTADDPALLASTKAFVAEIQAVAPSTLAGSWKVLGGALIALVGTRGDLTRAKQIDAVGVRAAVSEIAADAKHNCGVDLSSTTRH